jgi:flavin-binding protein dodecin
MADSVYKVIELIGTSTESWEKPRRLWNAPPSLASRWPEVVELDMVWTRQSDHVPPN